MRFVAAALGVTFLLPGCGGDTPPATPLQPTPATPVVSEWTLAGRITTTLSGEPVAGAVITAGDLTATTDGTGSFELRRQAAPGSPLAVSVSAAGHVPRDTRVSHPRPTPLVVDIIAERSPFDLAFFRALVRNALESSGELEMTRRWTRDPTFYLRTVDDTGKTLEPEVLEVLSYEIPRAFAEWTGGRYRATVETGTDDRAQATGLVRVSFTRLTQSGSCARATIGGNHGWMTFNVDYCGCGSLKIDPRTIWHEVGHIAGFWHVEGHHVMDRYFRGTCTRWPALSAAEQRHARVAYERTWGNLDPDRDPDWFSMLQPGDVPLPVVTCTGPR